MQFTKEQVIELTCGSEIDIEYGENRRWSRTNISVVKHNDKFYELYWEEGLTESQENEFFAQDAPEVEQVERTITEKVWVAKK